MDKSDILKRPEFILDDDNFRHYIMEGTYPDNVVTDCDGVVWMPVRDRQVRKKQRVDIKT